MTGKPIPLTTDPDNPDSPKGAIPVDIFGESDTPVEVPYVDVRAQRMMIGANTEAAVTGQDGISLGNRAKGSGTSAMALGLAAQAGGNDSIAIGRSSNVYTLASRSIAIGQGSTVGGHADSVALGAGVEASGPNQVAVGNRDLEIQDATKGVVLQSPDGSRWRLTIDDTGDTTWTKL